MKKAFTLLSEKAGILQLFLQQILLPILALLYGYTLMGQAPSYQIQGPHMEYKGPYLIRIYINYVQPPDDLWTQGVDLPARTQGILDRLNAAFNLHDIHFIGTTDPCNPSYQVITASNYIGENLHPNALDIFDKGGSEEPAGSSYFIPNNYCEVSGAYGNLPACHSELMVQVVGHCLGLSKLHNGASPFGGCWETGGLCPYGEPDCYCCGDYVCDTPVTPPNITVNANCSQSVSPPGLSPDVFRNYMASVEPAQCRDRFTPGQVGRMWDYLALAPVLQPCRLKEVSYPGSIPSGVSGNIVVKSGELVISSPLEMLPGATIRVKRGAKLRVASTITGACGKTWRGIVVEGTGFDITQSPAQQGQVEVMSGGVIEHAEFGIDVQDVLGYAVNTSTGGGIVKLHGNCRIKDNITGVRFAIFPAAKNRSILNGPVFEITDDYRGGSRQPVLLDLVVVTGINIRMARFLDLREPCLPAAERAIGIKALNAGFNVSRSCRFEQLYRGIRADNLNELNGSMTVTGSRFEHCYRGIEVVSSGSFVISGNTFKVDKPEVCPTIPSSVIGVAISGMTTGFLLSDNTFYSDYRGDDPPVVQTIGTICNQLGAGMGNTILKNDYSNLFAGSRASGGNGYAADGLLYLCNTYRDIYSGDLSILNGSIRKIQGEVPAAGPVRAAGNVFSAGPQDTLSCSIVNNGLEINYYFYEGHTLQNPGTPGLPGGSCTETGYVTYPVSQINSTCADPAPCHPCPPIEVENWKTAFHSNRQEWLSRTAALPGITDPTQQAEAAEAVRRLRIAMNRNANHILTHYSLDTLGVQTDSIIRWLGLVQTYPADARLARHYFFTGDFGHFDTLWSQIPLRYSPDEYPLEEFEHLGAVYQILRGHLDAGGTLHTLPDDIRERLIRYKSKSDESGFLAETVLFLTDIARKPYRAEAFPPSASNLQQAQLKNNQTPALRVYPNPARDLLRIDYPGGGQDGYIRLLDMQGRLQRLLPLSASGKTAELPVGDLPEGLYLAQWFCNGQTGYVKVMIVH